MTGRDFRSISFIECCINICQPNFLGYDMEHSCNIRNSADCKTLTSQRVSTCMTAQDIILKILAKSHREPPAESTLDTRFLHLLSPIPTRALYRRLIDRLLLHVASTAALSPSCTFSLPCATTFRPRPSRCIYDFVRATA